MSEESSTEPYALPGVASAEAGHVVLDGPDGIAIALTLEAAQDTGESLIKAAEAARRQRDDQAKD